MLSFIRTPYSNVFCKNIEKKMIINVHKWRKTFIFVSLRQSVYNNELLLNKEEKQIIHNKVNVLNGYLV